MNASHHLRQRASQIGLAALAAAVLVTGAAWRGAAAGPQASGTHAMPVVTSPIAHAVAGGRDSYADVVNVVAPAVVTVHADGKARMSQTEFQMPDGQVPGDDLLRRFFGEQFGQGAAEPVRPRPAPSAAGAAPARARVGRRRRGGRLHPHQQPRDRRRGRHQGRSHRRPHAVGQAGRHRQGERSRAAQDQRVRSASDRARQLRRGPGRRRRPRGGQPAQSRTDGDDGHHQREGPIDQRRRRQLRRLPADRRADQPRQLRRRAREHEGRARRHQLADSVAVRRQHRDRLRDSGEHGAPRHGRAADERQR